MHKDIREIDTNLLYPDFFDEKPEENPQGYEDDIGVSEVSAAAENILREAREKAEEIYAQARESGYAEGLEQGYNEGMEKADSEIAERIEAINGELQREVVECIKDMEHIKEKHAEQHVEDLKNIALAIGEKIVQTSLKASDDVIRRMVLSAISRMKKTAWAKIYIGSSGQKMTIEGDQEFLKELGTLSDNVKVIIMDEDELGSCLVETPEEIIDAGVKTQLDNIKDIIENARE